MNAKTTELMHGTSIALGEWAALICGPPGSGKSDLALRCLALGRSEAIPEIFRLVSDDQTVVARVDQNLVVSAPESIRGRIEVRGVGVVEVPTLDRALLLLRVDLTDAAVERLPDIVSQTTQILGQKIFRMSLRPFEASAPAKLALAMQLLAGRLQSIDLS